MNERARTRRAAAGGFDLWWALVAAAGAIVLGVAVIVWRTVLTILTVD